MNNRALFLGAIILISVLATQISNLRREKINSLEGTLWYSSFNSNGQTIRSLGYRFINDHAVELLNGNTSLGIVEYEIKDNKIFVKHSCGTEELVSRGDDLVELPRKGGLPFSVNFKKVN